MKIQVFILVVEKLELMLNSGKLLSLCTTLNCSLVPSDPNQQVHCTIKEFSKEAFKNPKCTHAWYQI